MQVTLQYAEEHLADLASAAFRGEEVEIAQAGKPMLKLVLAGSAATRTSLLDSARGQIQFAADWDSVQTNAEIANSFESSVLFPSLNRE